MIGRSAPRCPPHPIINGGVINVNHHHIGPIPICAVRRGCELKLVEPESVPHHCHIEGDGMMTVCKLEASFTKWPVVLYVLDWPLVRFGPGSTPSSQNLNMHPRCGSPSGMNLHLNLWVRVHQVWFAMFGFMVLNFGEKSTLHCCRS